MDITRRDGLRAIGATALAMAVPGGAIADDSAPTTHEVEMLNRDRDTRESMIFKPAVLRVKPGDTVRFVATDKGHNSESSKDMLPEGAEAWAGKIGEEIEITFEVEGAYGYNCRPHQTVGMVGLILCGEVNNLDALKEVRQRGKARARFEEYFAMADEILANEAS
ncbi:MAG: pseudoazurin [Pseudomonadota bacterium]